MINNSWGANRMKVYGYIRVSTREQNTDRQQEALKEFSVKNNLKYTVVFEDKASGKDFERPQYKTLKAILRSGDIVIIKELDRLGRNYNDIQTELQDFKSKGIKILILDIPMLQGIQDELLYTVLQDMIINLMGYVAQKEREKNHARVMEGLINAKAKGIKLGRPGMTLPKDFRKYYDKWKAKEITAVEFAKLLNVGRATIYRYIKEYEI
jgi:DNA invertase Pin-like site-specific DNA recombinase